MIEAIGVVVPAHDEEELIPACLASVAVAAEQVGVPVTTVVVLDACHDLTAARVGTATTVTVAHRCVGLARRAGVEHLLRTIERPPSTLWLASTDADTEVPPDWLSGMLRLADGVDVVLGTAVPNESPVLGAWRPRHVLADGHRHVHGANLGVRADAYLAIGGWPALCSGEDVELARRAMAGGLLLARTGEIPVRTSARTVGRAPDGFAAYLARLTEQAG